MQEEVEKKTVDLAIKSSKVTAKTLIKGLRLYINHVKKKNVMKDDRVKGQQSVKDLIGQGQVVSSIPIADKGIRDFKKLCNKYGVDFAIVIDKTVEPAQFTVFFKAKDADAITNVVKEYSAKQLKKQEKIERPSVLEKLKKLKEVVAKTPRKVKEKWKEHER